MLFTLFNEALTALQANDANKQIEAADCILALLDGALLANIDNQRQIRVMQV